MQGKPFKVANPFCLLTKTDIFELINKINCRNFIGSTVSCSKTFQRLETATHCGCCFQCIDRRLAAYASGLQEVDNVGIYSKDIFSDPIDSPETKTTAIDYIRQAISFATTNDDAFGLERLSELADIVEYIDRNEADGLEKVWQLSHRHGLQVILALKTIQSNLDDLRFNVKKGVF